MLVRGAGEDGGAARTTLGIRVGRSVPTSATTAATAANRARRRGRRALLPLTTGRRQDGWVTPGTALPGMGRSGAGLLQHTLARSFKSVEHQARRQRGRPGAVARLQA